VQDNPSYRNLSFYEGAYEDYLKEGKGRGIQK